MVRKVTCVVVTSSVGVDAAVMTQPSGAGAVSLTSSCAVDAVVT